MFDAILSHPDLWSLCRSSCFENQIGIDFSEKLTESLENGRFEQIMILKIDAYYHPSKMAKPPPSIDCLIIVKCVNACYEFYLVELRNVVSPKGLKKAEMNEKFRTTIEDFLTNRFQQIFMDKNYCINKFELYCVTDAYRLKNLKKEQYQKRISVLEKELLLLQNIFTFRDKKATIKLKLPNPVIKEC
jgi:hypothetical protein